MCRGQKKLWAWGLGLIAWGAVPLWGQDQAAEADRDVLLQRLDSLEQLWEATKAPSGLSEDWIREPVGPLHMVAAAHEWAPLRGALERQLGALPAWTRSGGLDGGVLLFAGAGTDPHLGPTPQETLVTTQPSRWASSPEARVSKALDRLLADLLPDDVQAWLAGHSVGQAPDRVGVYRSVVAAGLEVTDRCRGGDWGDCRMAMGLTARPMTEAYTAEELRRVVASADRGWTPREAEWKDCVAGKDRACRAFFEPRGNEAALLRPFPPSVRHSVLRTALEVGGEGALARLRQAVEGEGRVAVAARLEAASGLPVPGLLATWRTRYVVTPEKRGGPPLSVLAMAIAWLGLASGYSSRRARWLDR